MTPVISECLLVNLLKTLDYILSAQVLLDMYHIGLLDKSNMIPIVDAAPRFRPRHAVLVAIASLAAIAPQRAAADIPGTNVDFMYYGRMGIGWTPSGQVVAGKYMNLGDHKA